MLGIEQRNVEGLGSKEMAFDKFIIWLVAYIVNSLGRQSPYEAFVIIKTQHKDTRAAFMKSRRDTHVAPWWGTVISLAQFQRVWSTQSTTSH